MLMGASARLERAGPMRTRLLVLVMALGCGSPARIPGPGPLAPHPVPSHLSVAEVMIVLDNSDAMAPLLDAARSELKQSVSATARYLEWGLTVTSGSAADACGPAMPDVLAPIPELANQPEEFFAQARTVTAALDTVTSGGERRIAPAIAGTALTDVTREKFMLLITSGADTCGSALIDAMTAQRPKNLRTIVVVLNTDPVPLDHEAATGGWLSSCPLGTDAECGALNSCEPDKLCTHPCQVARNADELHHVLAGLTSIDPEQECWLLVDEGERTEQDVQVKVDGEGVPAGDDTWSLRHDRELTLHGSLCSRWQAATADTPMNLEVLINSP
jgi:hypothetical protein